MIEFGIKKSQTMHVDMLKNFHLSDVPDYVKSPIRFKRDKELEHIKRDGRVLYLPRKTYNRMLKKHECLWLHKVFMMAHEVGKLKFIENGVEYEGKYSYWAKDWHVHMTKPFDIHLGRHMMYMIPATFWIRTQRDVYKLMKNEMISKSKEMQENDRQL